MKLEFEEYVIDIAERISELGNILEVSTTRWISRPPDNEAVKDATLAFYVDGKRPTKDIVLLISNASFSNAVGEDVARARDVATCVSQRVGRHIISPVCEGTFGNQTWAAFSRLSPLSDYRLPRLFQKPGASKRILPWITELAMETKDYKAIPSDYEEYFVRPLSNIVEDPDISSSLRQFAEKCRTAVLDRGPNLFTVVQHGDFWIGNIMFQRRKLPDFNPSLGDFSVIDWRGARIDGYPCTDAIRFCSSLYRTNSSKSNGFLKQYLESLDISDFEMDVYCLLSLGQLGENLDQFPKQKYRQLCEATFEFLRAHNAIARSY